MKAIFFIIIICISYTGFSQSPFNSTYGGVDFEASVFINTYNSTQFMMSITEEYQSNKYRSYIMYCDKDGNHLEGNSVNNYVYEITNSIFLSKNSTVINTGFYHNNSDLDILIQKTDTSGNELWINNFGGVSFERVPFATSGSNARKAKPEIENKNTIEQSKLNIVPNPASKQTAIIFNKTQSGLLAIYSIDGKIVKKINVFAKESVNIDVSELTKGIYILKFTTEHNGSLKYAKLIVQ